MANISANKEPIDLSNTKTVREIARSYSAREHIMDVAQIFAMTRGVNSFSYKDIANEVGIKTPSIHYHFPKKEDLAAALMDRYLDRFHRVLNEFDQTISDPKEKLRAYVNSCVDCTDNALQVCLCGMMASDFLTLSEKAQKCVQEFIDFNEKWIEKVLKDGKKSGDLDFQVSYVQAARLIFGLIEGCIITAHAFPEEERIAGLSNNVLKLVSA